MTVGYSEYSTDMGLFVFCCKIIISTQNKILIKLIIEKLIKVAEESIF